MSKVFRRPMFRRGGGVKTMDGVMHGIETRSMNNLGGRIGYAFGTEQLVQGDTPQTLGPVTHGKGISNIDTGNFDLSNSAEYTQMYPSDGGIDIDLAQIAKIAQSIGISYKQLLAMTKQVAQQHGLGLKAALKVIMNQLAEGDVSLLDQLEGDQGANVEQFGSSDMVPFEDQSGIATVRNGQEMMASGGRIGFANGPKDPVFTSDIENVKSQMTAVDALAGPAPDHLSQLLISGGLNLVSGVGAGTGSKLGDIAAAYKDPTAQAFKGMAEDRTSKRSLAASLLKGTDAKGFNKYLKIADQMLASNAPGTEGVDRVTLAKRLWDDDNKYRQQKSEVDIEREDFNREAESYTRDKNNKGNSLIKIVGGREIATARRKLAKERPELHEKVDVNKPYVDPRVTTTQGKNGILLVEEGDRFRFKSQRVYYDTGTNKWYLFDGEKLIPQ